MSEQPKVVEQVLAVDLDLPPAQTEHWAKQQSMFYSRLEMRTDDASAAIAFEAFATVRVGRAGVAGGAAAWLACARCAAHKVATAALRVCRAAVASKEAFCTLRYGTIKIRQVRLNHVRQ